MKVIINRMKKLHTAILCTLLFFGGYVLLADSDFATEVVAHSADLDGSGIYNDPQAVLGQPATWNSDVHAVSMVAPAWDKDENGNPIITTIGADSYIVVKFDHHVEDDPDNPFGVDFLVFGNSYYTGPDSVTETTDMESFYLSGGTFTEPLLIAVSQDGVNWYEYTNGPYGDTGYPTQARAWDRKTHIWGDLLDFTKPVNPADYPFTNTVPHSDGKYYIADIIDYSFKGSAGGTGFDLAESGLKWIQYVKIYGDDSHADGEIDAISDVAPFYDLNLTVVMPADSGSLKVSPAPPTYTVHSETDLSDGAYTYNYKKDTVVTVTAVPNTGWQCAWSGPVNGTGSTVTVNMDSAKDVTVSFSVTTQQDLSGVGIDVAAGRLTDTDAKMQYQLNGGAWNDCAAPYTAVTFIEGAVIVREKADTSNTRTVATVGKPPPPAYSVDYLLETTLQNVPATESYSINHDMSNAVSGTGVPVSLEPGTDLYFQTPATKTAMASDIQVLSIAARPPAPGVSVDNENSATAVLHNATTAMEYKLDGGEYSDITADLADGTDTVNLLGPHTLLVRVKSSGSEFASEPTPDLDTDDTAPSGTSSDNIYSTQMYRGNSFNYTINKDKIAERWRFNPSDDGSISINAFLRNSRTAVSADGAAVFVFGQNDSGNTGQIIALDAFYGKKIWSVDVATYSSYDSWSSPVYSNGYIYWAGSDGSGDAYIYKINAKNGSTDEVSGGWVICLPDSVEIVNASPTIAAGKVFISSFNDMHYALNIVDGSVAWSNSDGGTGEGAMAFDSSRNLVYQTIFEGTHKLRAYNAENGTPVWTSAWDFINAPRNCAITYKADKIYIQDYNFSGDGKIYVADAANNGALLWSKPTPVSGNSAPSVDDDGNVYVFGDYDGSGKTRAYSKSGDILWTSDQCGGWSGSPASSGDYVFAGSQSGNLLYLLKKSDGTTATAVPGSGPVAFGNRTFFTVGNDGTVYAYSTSNDFADSVEAYDDSGSGSLNNPLSALNRPTVDTVGDGTDISTSEPVPVVNVYSPSESSEVVTVGIGSSGLTVKFDHPIQNSRNNPYGVDFIIFGNTEQGIVGGDTWKNRNPGTTVTDSSITAGSATVSVSEDGITWHTFTSGPFGDDFCPTFGRIYDDVNPYRPDSSWDWNEWWGAPADATLALNPSWHSTVFSGKTVKEASLICGRSAGGTGFDIASLGLNSIQYVRVVSDGRDAQIDAVADARINGDITAPSSVSDFAASQNDKNINLNWSMPDDDDLAGVLILRQKDSPVTSISPSDGTAYYPHYNSSIDSSKVIYSGSATSFSDTPPSSGTYNYKIYAFDNLLNYSTAEDASKTITQITYNVLFTGDGTPGVSFFGETDQRVVKGEDAGAVTAVSPAGYSFVNWTGDNGLSSNSNPLSVTNITADMTITANFAINSYLLTYTAGEHGSINGNSVQSVTYASDGSEVEAVAESGYHFISWSDGVTTPERRDLHITSDVSVTADFAVDSAPTYSLIVNHGNGGGVFEGGAVVAILADNPPEHYTFSHWSSDGGGTFTDAGSSNTVFLMPNADTVITANFAITTYTLTYSATAGGAIIGTSEQTVEYGKDGGEVNVVADAGYHFTSWSDGVTTPKRTDSAITSDLSVIANFAKNRYTLTYSSGDHGSVDGNLNQTLLYGENGSEVTAVPDENYIFDKWSDGVGTSNRKDLNISSDISVKALFTRIPDRITLGSLITLSNDDLNSFDEEFSKRPRVYGRYIHPQVFKVKKAPTRPVTKINAANKSTVFQSAWLKKVTLYSKNSLRKARKAGDSTSQWLREHPIGSLDCRLVAKVRKSNGTLLIQNFKNIKIVPPVILSMMTPDGKDVSAGVPLDTTVIIKGRYFGYKLPSVNLEYSKNGKISRKRLKVIRKFLYKDYRGKEDSSCMDTETGESTIYLKTPKDGFPSGTYSLVLENKIGIALDSTTGRVPEIKLTEE